MDPLQQRGPHPAAPLVDRDDASSVASFENVEAVGTFVPPPPPPPFGLSIPPPLNFKVLKVDGKVPEVLYVLKYIGWNDRIVDCKWILPNIPFILDLLLTDLLPRSSK